MNKFKINDTYRMNWIGDSELKTPVKIIGRTEKTVLIIDLHSKEQKRCKINFYDNQEYIFPTGRYSMAPVLKASNIIL